MEKKDSAIKVPESYQKLTTGEVKVFGRRNTVRVTWCLSFVCLALLVAYSVISVWCLKSQVDELQKKIILMEMRADVQILKSLQELTHLEMERKRASEKADEEDEEEDDDDDDDEDTSLPSDEDYNPIESELDSTNEENSMGDYSYGDREDSFSDSDENPDDENPYQGFKRKREIRDHNESSVEKDLNKYIKNETEDKAKSVKSSAEKASTEMSSIEKSSSELSSSKEKNFPTSYRRYYSSTRKPHYHRKHRKSRIGSAERFFTETHSTTSAPIQVRQSRTKPTQLHGIDKTLWLQNQKFQQHTSPLKDTITKEEALKKGYGKHLEDVVYDLETSQERVPDALSYNMIMIHFSADTSHYSRDRDPHYFGNGRMQIKSEVYKDWKPAHWTQGVGMSKYFHLHQGRVTVSTTGIYLIYAQIQYSNVQEVNGFSVFRNKEVVVQCITTSTHPDKHEIKSNTCAISTTILLQSNDSVCIKDLHHGRYVVLTPEKSYFGLVLLSPFKN